MVVVLKSEQNLIHFNIVVSSICMDTCDQLNCQSVSYICFVVCSSTFY